MSKTEILEELPKLTKTERQEIRLRLAELDSEDWLDDEDRAALHKALMESEDDIKAARVIDAATVLRQLRTR